IDLEHIDRAKHDSDSDVFDETGNVVQANFDAMFTKYDADKNNSLDANEFTKMRQQRGESTLGKVASAGEFGLLTKIAPDSKVKVAGKDVNAISRDRLQQFYNGTLFDTIAAERAAAVKTK
ncbi:MAG: hypothetical protein JWM80_1257, partial [Cyanobacteria bacterium RYN_339]|nr:hypothetical protein [Cyanobacteria bacterium RYN_339]